MKRNRVWVVEWLDDSGERPGNWRPGNDAFDTRDEAERDITEWHKRWGLEGDGRIR
jgi:hypothetical protein